MNKFVSSFTAAPLSQGAVARVSLAPSVARLVLRARGDLAALNAALGVALPTVIGQRAGADAFEVLCLGPDEWMLHMAPDQVGAVTASCAALMGSHPHSLVDVSGREVTLRIDGPRAAELLTIGCAREVEAIPVGQGRRTAFDNVTVILWRDEPAVFRLDVWNSFAPHVAGLLETGCRELAAEAGQRPR